MPVWRAFLRRTAALHDRGPVQAIDSTSYAQRTSSRNYAKRVSDAYESVKTTALVDCTSGAILDLHCPTKQPLDSQVAWQLLRRNFDKLTIITADKG